MNLVKKKKLEITMEIIITKSPPHQAIVIL